MDSAPAASDGSVRKEIPFIPVECGLHVAGVGRAIEHCEVGSFARRGITNAMLPPGRRAMARRWLSKWLVDWQPQIGQNTALAATSIRWRACANELWRTSSPPLRFSTWMNSTSMMPMNPKMVRR